MNEISRQLSATKLEDSKVTDPSKSSHLSELGHKSRRSNHSRIQGAGWGGGNKPGHNRRSNPSGVSQPQFEFIPPTVCSSSRNSGNGHNASPLMQDPNFPLKSFHVTKSAPVKGKNTECFTPNHEPADLRIVCAPVNLDVYNKHHTSRDVVVVQDIFKCNDYSIYQNLLDEMSNNVSEDVWVPWHGDTHVIANDKLKWKKYCPTFNRVLDVLCKYFEMEAKATRLNWYRDNSEWKPYHHDAAAIKADKAESQNITVAASFGAEREVAFEHAKTKTTVSIPLANGSVYSFGKDVNIIWRHGIPQLSSSVQQSTKEGMGRFSVIVWGWTRLGELENGQ